MKTIWIDAGHGGKDCGAVNKNLNLLEKDLTLMLAKEVEKQLKQRGINVVMTRNNDITKSYIERYKAENRNKCDLAISIHLNSCGKENSATGTEVWIHSRATAKTMNFGKELVLGITQVDGLKSRGVKKGYPTNANADFWCNRLTKSMSALVEVCFVNNDADARNFMKKYKEYGAAISNVCVNFL